MNGLHEFIWTDTSFMQKSLLHMNRTTKILNSGHVLDFLVTFEYI